MEYKVELKGFLNKNIKFSKNKKECTISNSNITKISGKFNKNTREYSGIGRIDYIDGGYYKGEMSNNNRNGLGTVYVSNSYIYSIHCEWSANIPKKPIYVCFVNNGKCYKIDEPIIKKHLISFTHICEDTLEKIKYDVSIPMDCDTEFKYRNGYYIGKAFYNIPSGYGYLITGKSSYEGYWNNGDLDSYGEYITEKYIYIGPMSNTLPHGYGTLKYVNKYGNKNERIQTIHTCFNKGIIEGGNNSMIEYNNSQTYYGTIDKQCNRQGYGTSINSKTLYYNCRYVDDKFDTECTFFFNIDNRMYFGTESKDAQIIGSGWKICDNILYYGMFKHNMLLNGYKINMTTMEIQEGTYSDSEELCGNGRIYYYNLEKNPYSYLDNFLSSRCDVNEQEKMEEIPTMIIETDWLNGCPNNTSVVIYTPSTLSELYYLNWTKKIALSKIHSCDGVYIGISKNNMRHGWGKMLYKSKRILIGYWKDDKPFGIMKYIGDFGEYHGTIESLNDLTGYGKLFIGTETDMTYRIITGKIVNGQPVGDVIVELFGKYKIYASIPEQTNKRTIEKYGFNTKYNVNFEITLKKKKISGKLGPISNNDKVYCYGIIQYHNGNKYEGNLVNFERSGWGILYLLEKNTTLEGEWVANKPYGKFNVKMLNSSLFFIGKITSFTNNSFKGKGTLYYNIHTKYIGKINNWKREGKGILVNTEKGTNYISCTWINDLQHGECIQKNDLKTIISQYDNGVFCWTTKYIVDLLIFNIIYFYTFIATISYFFYFKGTIH